MAESPELLWVERDAEGIECQISRRQWQEHVAKRPEIAGAFELTKTAMLKPEVIEPDRHRLNDEAGRYFRLLRISGQERWARYMLVVSVKYVRQDNGRWIKFYQSCWYERQRESV